MTCIANLRQTQIIMDLRKKMNDKEMRMKDKMKENDKEISKLKDECKQKDLEIEETLKSKEREMAAVKKESDAETERVRLKYEKEIKSVNDEMSASIERIKADHKEQIEDLEQTAIQEINWDTVNDLNSTKDHMDFLYKLLTNKDSFIRKKIIDQNLAYLNNRLTYYLDKLGLPHTVVFKNDLSVEITQLGQDLDFDNLSRGERNRLILGMSWSFRDVWESLYQNINLLFIDELVDSGMDANGVENSMSILKKMGRERQKNIYLISHKEELASRVTNVLKVIKENGFTSYDNDVEVMQ